MQLGCNIHKAMTVETMITATKTAYLSLGRARSRSRSQTRFRSTFDGQCAFVVNGGVGAHFIKPRLGHVT